MHPILEILWLVIIIIAFPYVVGPLLIRLFFKHKAYATYKPVEFNALPESVRRRFTAWAPDLAREGFQAVEYFHHVGAVAMVQAYLGCWSNVSRGQMITLIAIAPNAGLSKYTIAFETTLSDGRRLITSNIAGDAGVFDDVEGTCVRRFPWLKTPNDLYEVHVYNEHKYFAPDAVRYVAARENLVATMQHQSACELRQQVHTGLFYETSASGVFRPTWRGSVMLVLRLLPPLKQIRTWQQRKDARADYRASQKQRAPRPSNVRVTDSSPFLDRQLIGFEPVAVA